MKWLGGLLALLCAACGGGTGAHQARPLTTVPAVDLVRYVGTWHEIARYPHRFQEGCVLSEATYRLRDDGRIAVTNRCREGGPDGPWREVSGTAWVVDTTTNARLKVRFFWPFYGSYWIIGLDPDYQWAIVGHPSRQYLWILSRTPQISTELYEELLERVRNLGYDTSRLVL